MFDQQKATGTEYTTTAAFLVVAFIFSPAILVLSRSWGTVSVVIAISSSVLCVGLAWLNWKKSSQLTIPSILTPGANTK
jgi:hypothetical protein